MNRLAGRYELHDRLGEGGMAEVWRATAHGDAGFTRRVAVKRLFAREADPGFERMFLDEARLTSRLHHQGIVSILDFGIEAGRPFQVLELVDGFDASRLARAGREQGQPLPTGLALHLCAEVGHALHFAHRATDDAGAPLNIVHRDVSPQNVLLSRAGDVKLSDFGIAFAEGRLEKTVGGVARGKPAYMAPEQAVRGAMDGRTDVFALGCVLHALLTGESPLRDENALIDLLSGIELRLSDALPTEVREVIARATKRQRQDRFPSAEAMALACAALVPVFLTGEPRPALAAWVRSVAPEVVVAPALPTTGKVPPPARPRRVAPWLVLPAVAGLGLGGAGWALWRPEVPVEAKVEPMRAPVVTQPAPVVLEPPPVVETPPPAPKRVVPAKKDTPPVVTTRGVLAIGGERLLRGEVFVDGVRVGTAPGHFEVVTGVHRVEVALPDGSRVGPKVMTLETRHTELAPLTWLE